MRHNLLNITWAVIWLHGCSTVVSPPPTGDTVDDSAVRDDPAETEDTFNPTGFDTSPFGGRDETDDSADDTGDSGDSGDTADSSDSGLDHLDTSGGNGCPPGEVLDCSGADCDPASWIGDGVCDDGLIDLACAATNWDGGDCTPTGGTSGSTGSGGSGNPCSAGQVPDCSGSCVDLAALGNGSCDAAFDCDAYGLDAGDCGTFGSCSSGWVPDCGTTGGTGGCSRATWLNDGACDSWLNCEAYGFDGGDC